MALTAIRPTKHRMGLRVVGDRLGARVDFQLIARFDRDIGQVDQGGRIMTDLNIGRRLCTLLDGGQKVGLMARSQFDDLLWCR